MCTTALAASTNYRGAGRGEAEEHQRKITGDKVTVRKTMKHSAGG